MSIGEHQGPGSGAGASIPTGTTTSAHHTTTEHRPSGPTDGAPGASASHAVDVAKDVAADAKQQAGDVIAQTKGEMASFLGQARSEVTTQLDAKGAEAASGLRTLSTQLQALANGRPEEAGTLAERLGAAQQLVQRLADRLEQGGSQGLVSDMSSFARRRPGSFLLGAAVAGFAAGRLLRVTTDGSSGVTATSGAGMGATSAERQTWGDPAVRPAAEPLVEAGWR